MGASAYDEITEWYDTWVGGDSTRVDQYFSAVEALLGDVRELRICDLACGQGNATRYLADHGARVVGIDVSAKMLEIAQRYEAAEPRLTGRDAERRPVWTEVPGALAVRCRAARPVASAATMA